MDFEELKVIWDKQTAEPLYAINQAALHAMVRRCKQQEHRRTFWCYGREIAINTLMSLAMFVVAGVLWWGDAAWLASLSWIRVPVTPWHVAAAILSGVIWLHCATYMFNARRRQLHREDQHPTSLHGDLKRALAHIEFQIGIARSIVWWGLLPSWFATGLGIVVIFHLKDVPAWAYGMMVLVMAAAFAFALACQYYVSRLRYEPRRRELQDLQAKLSPSGETNAAEAQP